MITDDESYNIIKQFSQDKAILLFIANWSEQSQLLLTKLKSIESILPDIHCIDVDDDNELTSKYDVYELPTIIIIKHNEVIEQLGNNKSLKDIIDAIRNA